MTTMSRHTLTIVRTRALLAILAAPILSLIASASVLAAIPPSGQRSVVLSLPRLHKARTAQQRPTITMPEAAAPARSMEPHQAEKPRHVGRDSAADHMANQLNRQELRGLLH